MFGYDAKDLYSTGSRGKDIGLGIVGGLSSTFNQPGNYYVKANYAGNGLANTDLGYMNNDNYVNPYDAMNALTSIMYEGKKDKQNGGIFDSMKERLSTMLGKPLFGIDNSNPYGLNTQEYTLPEVAGVGGGTIGGQRYNPQNYSYGLPTQSLNFNKFWE